MLAQVTFRLAGCGGQQLILVPAYLNDHGPHDFVLDTGAAISLISPKLSLELEIPILGSEERTGAGGRIEVQLGKVDSLAIGNPFL
jgi:hypothetical protein